MTIGQLKVLLSVDSKGVGKGIGEAKKQLGAFEKGLKSVRSTIGKAFSVTAVMAFGKAAVDAYGQQEAAIANVRATLESTSQVAGRTLDQLLKDAQDLQKTSLFGDEQLLQNVTAQLLTFTNITEEQFDRAQQAVVDLAAKLGGEGASESHLRSAALQLGKALNDPVSRLGELSRAGITFSEEQKKVIKALAEGGDMAGAQAVVLKELERQYGGTAAAIASVGTGPMKQLANSMGDLLEVVGGLITDGLKPLIDGARKVANYLNDLDGPMKKIVVGSGAMTVAIGGIALAFGPVGVAVTAAIAAIVLLVKNFDALKAWFTSKFPNATKALTKAWKNIVTTVKKAVADIKRFWDRFGDDILRALSFAADVVIRQVDAIIGYFDYLISNIADTVNFIVSVFRGDWQGAFDAARRIVERIWNYVGRIIVKGADVILSGVQRVVEFFDSDWGAAIQRVRDNLQTMVPAKDVQDDLEDVKDAASDVERTVPPKLERLGEAGVSAAAGIAEAKKKLQLLFQNMMDAAEGVAKLTEEEKRLLEAAKEAARKLKELQDEMAAGRVAEFEREFANLEKTVTGEVIPALRLLEDELDIDSTPIKDIIPVGRVAEFEREFANLEKTVTGEVIPALRVLEDDLDIDSTPIKDLTMQVEEFFTAMSDSASFGFSDVMDSIGANLQGVAGLAQQFFASTGGWGAAIATGMGVLKGFGVDVEGFFNGILGNATRMLGEFARSLGNLFGIGGGRRSPEERISDLISAGMAALRNGLAAINRKALVLGDTFDKDAAAISLLEDVLINLLNNGVNPNHPAIANLTALLDQLRESSEGAAAAIGKQAGTGGGLPLPPGFQQALEDLMDNPWFDVGEASLRVKKILEEINAVVEKQQLLAQALGEDFNAASVRAELLREALKRYIEAGGDSTHVIEYLAYLLREAEAAAAAAGDAIEDTGRVLDDVFGGAGPFVQAGDDAEEFAFALGELDRAFGVITEDLQSSLANLGNVALVAAEAGESFNIAAERARLIRDAMLDLLAEGMEPTSAQFQALAEDLRAATAEAAAFGDAINPMQELERIMDMVSDRTARINAEFAQYGDETRRTEDMVRLLNEAMIQMRIAGLANTEEFVSLAEQLMELARASGIAAGGIIDIIDAAGDVPGATSDTPPSSRPPTRRSSRRRGGSVRFPDTMRVDVMGRALELLQGIKFDLDRILAASLLQNSGLFTGTLEDRLNVLNREIAFVPSIRRTPPPNVAPNRAALTRQPINVQLHVSRRQFGQAMAEVLV